MSNCVSVMTKILLFHYLATVGEPGKRHNVRAQNAQDVFDCLNPLSLGTMSASAYIENVA